MSSLLTLEPIFVVRGWNTLCGQALGLGLVSASQEPSSPWSDIRDCEEEKRGTECWGGDQLISGICWSSFLPFSPSHFFFFFLMQDTQWALIKCRNKKKSNFLENISCSFFPSCFHLKCLATLSNWSFLLTSNNVSPGPFMAKTVVRLESSGLFPFSFFIFSSKT